MMCPSGEKGEREISLQQVMMFILPLLCSCSSGTLGSKLTDRLKERRGTMCSYSTLSNQLHILDRTCGFLHDSDLPTVEVTCFM